MLTTRRFNRRRAAEIRAKHQARRERLRAQELRDQVRLSMVRKCLAYGWEMPDPDILKVVYQVEHSRYEVTAVPQGRLVGHIHWPWPDAFGQAMARVQAEKIRTEAALELGSSPGEEFCAPLAAAVQPKGWRACLAKLKGALWP